MKWSGKTFMSLGLMGVAAWVVIKALKWPLRTALFPVTMGILVFLVTIGELLLGLSEGKEIADKKSETEVDSSEQREQPLPARGLILGFAWTLGFFLLILLVGFPISVPLFAFLYLKIHGGEGWRISGGLAAAALVCFYVLFVWLLHIPFPDGWVQKGLRLLGSG